ncbi:MAG: hypothetical protein FWG10_09005 [Eubacteriaceae bacterium]|nr:hypothetical protein [Eubacteriaceae bacterium]
MLNLLRNTRDQGFKTVLGNRDLFAQFLKDFVQIEIFGNVSLKISRTCLKGLLQWAGTATPSRGSI